MNTFKNMASGPPARYEAALLGMGLRKRVKIIVSIPIDEVGVSNRA